MIDQCGQARLGSSRTFCGTTVPSQLCSFNCVFQDVVLLVLHPPCTFIPTMRRKSSPGPRNRAGADRVAGGHDGRHAQRPIRVSSGHLVVLATLAAVAYSTYQVEIPAMASREQILAALVCGAALLFGLRVIRRCVAASTNSIYHSGSNEATRLLHAVPSLRKYHPTPFLIGGWIQTLATEYAATPVLEHRREVLSSVPATVGGGVALPELVNVWKRVRRAGNHARTARAARRSDVLP